MYIYIYVYIYVDVYIYGKHYFGGSDRAKVSAHSSSQVEEEEQCLLTDNE